MIPEHGCVVNASGVLCPIGSVDPIRVRVRVSVRVGARAMVRIGVRVRIRVKRGLLPTTSHYIFYSRVGQIAIFRHCQP